MDEIKKRSWIVVGAFACFTAVFYVTQMGQNHKVNDMPISASMAQGTVGLAAQGRMAEIDPVTGKLVSSSKGGKRLVPQGALTQGGLPPIQYANLSDGTVQANLNGRFRVPLMAKIACDGKILTAHTNDSSPLTCEE